MKMGFLLSHLNAILVGGLLVLCFSIGIYGQGNGTAKSPATLPKKLPSVKQIDENGLRKALTPSAKPLLVNFWATWCDPCREEFPDLVKLDAEYKGRIDFITISLDELSEIDRDVPK